MLAGHKFGACLPTFGSCADRYCLSGYGPPRSMDQMLNRATKVKGMNCCGCLRMGMGALFPVNPGSPAMLD